MKVAKVIIFLITMTDAKHHHSSLSKTVSESKENFFGNINKAIHSLLNSLFDTVNLATNFSKESNTKLLLTMHYDLSNIADKNVDALNEVQNIIKVNVDNRTEEMIKLDSVIEELFHEKHFDLYEILTGKDRHKHSKRKTVRKRSKKKYHINITSDFSDSKEFKDFFIKFFAKVNNLTIKDYKRSSKLGRSPVPLRTNLKAWEPSSSFVAFSNETNTRRIYKGRKASVNAFPFIVSIHIMGEFSCTGSIISRGYIITAASCLQVAYQNDFFKTNIKSIYVRMGSDYTMLGGETIPAQDLYFHPEFEPEHMKNNLAIIRLERRIKFTRHQKRIRRISWNDSPENLTEDVKEVLILGWGAKKTDQVVKKDEILSVDILEVYNFNRCMEVYTEDFVSKDNFCAGSVTRNGGACNGDVGGPGVVGAMLTGVISFGTPECGKAPTVFTKLGYYSQWIKSIMEQDKKEEDKSNVNQNSRRKFSLKLIHLNVTSLSKKEKKGKKRFRVHNEEYPDEVNALKEILVELLKTDNDIVDEVLYGDVYEDLSDIFLTKENNEDILFLNKSYLTYPNKPRRSKKTYITKPLVTTTQMHHSLTEPTFLNENITPINSYRSHNIRQRQKSISESEEEIHNTYTENDDYTDNYEMSSEEERGMSIEAQTTATTVTNKTKSTVIKVDKTTTRKTFTEDHSSGTWESSDIKEDSTRYTSSESVAKNSDDTSSNSEQNKNKYDKNKKYLEETENESGETKSKSDEFTTKFVPFVGTPMDLQSLDIVVGVQGNTKKPKIVNMRNNHHSKKKKLTSVQDTDKNLATRPYFYKFDSNKYIKSPSKSKKMNWDASVELRILHG